MNNVVPRCFVGFRAFVRDNTEESYRQIFGELFSALATAGRPVAIAVHNFNEDAEAVPWKEREETFFSRSGALDAPSKHTVLRSIAVDFDFNQIKGLGRALFDHIGDAVLKSPAEMVRHVVCGCEVHFARMMLPKFGNDHEDQLYRKLRKARSLYEPNIENRRAVEAVLGELEAYKDIGSDGLKEWVKWFNYRSEYLLALCFPCFSTMTVGSRQIGRASCRERV